MRVLFFIALLALATSCNTVDDIYGPAQPTSGPGGSDYSHATVRITDSSETGKGYWIFEPADPSPDSADVVIFNHGWGAYNPMSYGGWIRHIVRRGNIVIFARYQYSMSTLPKSFTGNASTAIRNALELLKSGGHTVPRTNRLVMVGHSFGGLITANLTILHDTLNIPQPRAVMLCQPGGMFGGRLDSYERFPEDVPLLMLVGADDNIVGDNVAMSVYKEVNSKRKNYIVHHPDDHGRPEITASHGEALSLFHRFNSGHTNPVIMRARWASQTDAVDYFCYWKLLDALQSCVLDSTYCNFAFGNTEEQRFMGHWSDGAPVEKLNVIDSLESR